MTKEYRSEAPETFTYDEYVSHDPVKKMEERANLLAAENWSLRAKIRAAGDRQTAMSMLDASVRIEHLIPLALSCHDSSALPDVFVEEFCESLLDCSGPDDKTVQPLIKSLPPITGLLGQDTFEAMDPDDIAEWFSSHGFFGFLAQIATPVRKYGTASDTSWMSSWGHYHTTWVYVDSPDMIAAAALAWAQQQAEIDKGKAS